MDTEVKFDIGTKCLFNVHTPVTVADVDGDFRLIEWIAEQGQEMNYAAHISRLLPIDAPQFTYQRALNCHRLAICDDCEKTSILETFCYDCGACAKCCQCPQDEDYCDGCGRCGDCECEDNHYHQPCSRRGKDRDYYDCGVCESCEDCCTCDE